jgi:hypothetical protein
MTRSRLREYQLDAAGVERLRGELKEAVVKLWPAGKGQDERYMAVNTLCNMALRFLQSETAESGLRATLDEANRCYLTQFDRAEKLQKEVAAKQAQIDRLMLEYCPDEMTKEQVEEWGRHQKPAPCSTDKPQPSPYSLGYNELAERVVELERELAFSNKRAENLLASLPVWRCREGQNPELLYSSYWFLKRSAKLTKPAQVGNTVFGVGVKERTVIERAQREHDYQQTPEREAARIDRGKTSMEAFQSHVAARSCDLALHLAHVYSDLSKNSDLQGWQISKVLDAVQERLKAVPSSSLDPVAVQEAWAMLDENTKALQSATAPSKPEGERIAYDPVSGNPYRY